MPRPASKRASTALADHRQRLRNRGLKRVEVQVGGEDAPLLRAVAAALTDPDRAAAARVLLQRCFAPEPGRSLKDLLAAAPSLDDLDLNRPIDFGRPVEL
mgnify:CR=1 FL=1